MPLKRGTSYLALTLDIHLSTGKCLTYNIRACTSIFVYFSHKCISLPPPGWVRAAHQHGTIILGTLIFEWDESKQNLKQLLDGPSPTSKQGIRTELSTYYADRLIALALCHKIHGYLVNIETSTQLIGTDNPYLAEIDRRHNAERLRQWVQYLRDQGRKLCPDWQVIWYDSVTYPDGHLAWQDAMTPNNMKYFTSSTGGFTNYTWSHPERLQFEGFHPLLALSAAVADSLSFSRSNVYIGIDVFGRNCLGQNDTCKSLSMVGPSQCRRAPFEDISDQGSALGLSVALFGQGWTWEHDSPPARSWLDWWDEDVKFWLDGSNAVAQHFSPAPCIWLCDETEEVWGLRTNFSTGSGTKWHVHGQDVLQFPNKGWSDAGVSAPKPHLAWPNVQYTLDSQGNQINCPVFTSLEFDQAWSGNVSLQIKTDVTLWIPILALDPLPKNAPLRVTLQLATQGKVLPALAINGKVYDNDVLAEEINGWYLQTTTIALPEMARFSEVHVVASVTGTIRIGQVDITTRQDMDGSYEAIWSGTTLSWPDFVPWCAYYEVFALGDDPVWLGTVSFTTFRTSVKLTDINDETIVQVRSGGAPPKEAGALAFLQS